ncbi:MAG: acyl-CoA dehydrogenase family protein [Candidatus Jordarchaeum sp.]|uniref:acyl-CoA dehydrogenase family protein n=1 Tax=Candidatus Jordarchaeum sp. TaxID=2823881 RepID=UPI00404A2499
MEKYPWWTDFQKQLADEVLEFAYSVAPRALEAVWKREHPADLVKMVGDKGWFGVLVPEEYGGMGKNGGVTSSAIITEGLTAVGMLGGLFFSTQFGGVKQLSTFGTPEQKERWLTRVARGEVIGALGLTEPFVGSDAAGIKTIAVKDGDEWVINGKKRFITNTGVANMYFVYAKTSNEPGDIQARRHLTAFVVDKGTPGFSVERINELAVFDAVRNGTLNFDNVRVSEENIVGGIGGAWGVLTNGLNFERLMIAVCMIAVIKEALRNALFFTERRVQFGQRTLDFESNQYRMADIIMRLKSTRLLCYYTAYQEDLGNNPIIEANAAKILATELARESAIDALQVCGGDAFTKYYTVEQLLRDSKINEVGGGTNEVLRRLIVYVYRRLFANEIRQPRRRIHKELRIPIPYFEPVEKKAAPTSPEEMETAVLEALGEDYFVNPGLHMKREELMEDTGLSDEQLDETLLSLEEKNLVDLWRDRRGVIRLAKATYEGLNKAKPLEFYCWYPQWSRKEERF